MIKELYYIYRCPDNCHVSLSNGPKEHTCPRCKQQMLFDMMGSVKDAEEKTKRIHLEHKKQFLNK